MAFEPVDTKIGTNIYGRDIYMQTEICNGFRFVMCYYSSGQDVYVYEQRITLEVSMDYIVEQIFEKYEIPYW